MCNKERNPHKNRGLIIVWADGAKVQRKSFTGEWLDSFFPSWDYIAEYRVKPVPTDVEKYGVEVGDVWYTKNFGLQLITFAPEHGWWKSLKGHEFSAPAMRELIFRRGVVNKL